MFILGDCGIPWYNPDLSFYDNWTKPGSEKFEHYQLKWLNDKPWTTFFIRGNHDNIDLINKMPIVKKFHANMRQMVYQNIIYDKIFYIDTPQYLTIEKNNILIIPGAESHDMDYIFEYDDPLIKEYIKNINKKFWKTGEEILYRVNHFSYWEEEGVNKELVEQLISQIPSNVDYVFSHAPRAKVNIYWNSLETLFKRELSLSEKILEEVANKISYKMWLHGHYHSYIELYQIFSLGLYKEILSLEEINSLYKKWNIKTNKREVNK